MAATSSSGLHCVVVTPERAVLDAPADFVALPMYDGELGVLAGRQPLIGRLGIGELRVRQGATVRRFLIDGGFAQVRGNTVTVLTPKAQPAEELSAASAEEALEATRSMIARSPDELAAKAKAQRRARMQRKIIELMSRPGISLD